MLVAERRRRRVRLLCVGGGGLALLALAVALLEWKDGSAARESAADDDHLKQASALLARCGAPPDKVASFRDLMNGPPRVRHTLAAMAATIVEKCGGASCNDVAECVQAVGLRIERGLRNQ